MNTFETECENIQRVFFNDFSNGSKDSINDTSKIDAIDYNLLGDDDWDEYEIEYEVRYSVYYWFTENNKHSGTLYVTNKPVCLQEDSELTNFATASSSSRITTQADSSASSFSTQTVSTKIIAIIFIA